MLAFGAGVDALFAHFWIERRVEVGRAIICRARHIALGIAGGEQQTDGQQNNEASHEPLVLVSDVLGSGDVGRGALKSSERLHCACDSRQSITFAASRKPTAA
jgi:hypothetical protein